MFLDALPLSYAGKKISRIDDSHIGINLWTKFVISYEKMVHFTFS
jgi:hypothetical protein